MDGEMNLEELGATLRSRREALGLTREALARRMALSPAYIWMIESATPRSGGHSSRPRRATLARWIEALEMDERAVSDVLRWAGYAATLGTTALSGPAAEDVPPAHVAERSPALSYDASIRVKEQLDLSQPRQRQRAMLLRRTADLLDRAAVSDELWDETITLLDTLLDFVSHRLAREQ
jgi:transcriptional regulator with XRE-family HTH domain